MPKKVATRATTPVAAPSPAAPPSPPRFLLDLGETARELHISRAGVFRLVRRGELRGSVKIGRRRLFPIAAIEAFIAAHTVDGKGGAA